MSEIDIYDHALSKVTLLDAEDGFCLFLFNLYEVNNKDIRFFLSEEDDSERVLSLHPPSDQLIKIKLKEDIYQKLKDIKVIKVFEVDYISGQCLQTYNVFR